MGPAVLALARAAVAACAGIALSGAARAVPAQVPPHAAWRTIETPRFRVTYTAELEGMARRAAASAESAYTVLAAHLAPPRGRIDIVVSDHVDISNGTATAFPTNRIVLFANPPITSGALRFVDDPVELLVFHELMHVFHLDRVRGIWRLGQRVFGRSPYLFPNAYQPSWLLEGMAVWHESRHTGSGRLVGSEHRMIARAAALAQAVPRLDQLSLANPRFPYAYSAYAYGSLFVDHLARTYGDTALRRFVEAQSRNIIPMWLDAPARRAFGRSLTRLYRDWTQSLLDSMPSVAPEMPGWRDVTVHGAYASQPRWADDSTVLYGGTSGRETYGVYELSLGSRIARRRIARRHTESPNVRLADGSLLYAQLEYDGPYRIRSDLYVDRARGGTTRLTRNARLSMPDARRDGLIVAMQTVPGAVRLALVPPDGRTITPITGTSDTGSTPAAVEQHWAEPRWSPDGRHIAAIRWRYGGRSELVVVDSAGSSLAVLFGARAVIATPSWSSDGRWVYFSSDHSGVTNLYRAAFDAGTGAGIGAGAGVGEGMRKVERLSNAATGLFEPEPSPDGTRMAAVVFRADGYHVGVAPLPEAGLRVTSADGAATGAAQGSGSPATLTAPRSRRYSPWSTLLPRYWLPFVEPALDEGTRIGAYTSGEDLVGRHAYQALLFVPTDNSGITGSLHYRNARLGQPLVELAASQDWSNFGCIVDQAQPGECAGTLRRRIRDASAGLLVLRPRIRTYSYASLSAGLETRDYATHPATLLGALDPVYGGVYHYPRLVLAGGWSNTQHPPLAISAEDGFSVAATSRWRWRSGDPSPATHSVVGTVAGYKSLDLPGFGHHALALRVAAGGSDNRGTGYLEIGGVSGGTLDVLPGYTVGEGRRTFGVRGFPGASLLGIRALGATAEYRAPLVLPGRGLGTLPLFLDRTSITVFGDAASAWCPGLFARRPFPNTGLCTQADYDFGRITARSRRPVVHLEPPLIASAGAELNVNAAILSWDSPVRYRLGVAAPVAGREHVADLRPVTVYFAVGAAF